MPRRRQKATYHRKLVITNPRRLATFFIIIAVVLVAIPQIAHNSKIKNQSAKSQLSTVNSQPSTNSGPIKIDEKLLSNQETSQPPLRIVIPKFNIDLSIVEAPVVNGVWETSETTASHGIGSANPGQMGNTVIFAHARQGLFLPMRDIAKDDLVYVLTKDHWYRYRVADSKLVNPDQVEVIGQTPDERLTLFTCSGFFDSKRLIVTASPEKP